MRELFFERFLFCRGEGVEDGGERGRGWEGYIVGIGIEPSDLLLGVMACVSFD